MSDATSPGPDEEHADGPARWVEVATCKDLQRRKKTLVTVDDRQIALFWVEGRVYALDNICVHRQKELVKGVILSGRVICPGHQWAFDLETGLAAKQGRCQPTFDVKIDGDVVYVNPEPRAEASAGTGS